MSWFYAIVAIAGIVAVVLIILPLLMKEAPKIVEVPQIIPMPSMPSMPSLPTEIKVSLPEISIPEISIPPFPEIPAFPEIDIPAIPEIPAFELPDFKGLLSGLLDSLPSLDEIADTIKDLTPAWLKDPTGYTINKVVTEPLTGLGEAIDQTLTDLGEVIDTGIIVATIPASPIAPENWMNEWEKLNKPVAPIVKTFSKGPPRYR